MFYTPRRHEKTPDPVNFLNNDQFTGNEKKN